jgi:putative aminopeptidase FrvX
MDDAARDRLLRLLAAFGPSGREAEAIALWSELAADVGPVEEDALGSATVAVGPADAPAVLLLGHIDQIGLIVTHIEDEGIIRIRNIGGWDARVLVGQRVLIRTQDGDLPGVIGSVPIHLQKPEDRTAGIALKDLWVDVGAKDGEEARRRVRIGDVAIVGEPPCELLGTRLTSRALDDRVGAWIALEAVRRLAARGAPAIRVVAAACTMEETLGDGARVVADRVGAALAIVIDVTHAADVPSVDKGQTGPQRLGSGPVITRGIGLTDSVAERLIATAEAEGIPYALEALAGGGSTATDVDGALDAVRGLRAALIGVPLRHMHSPAEVCDIDDLDACADLIAAFCASLGPADLA